MAGITSIDLQVGHMNAGRQVRRWETEGLMLAPVCTARRTGTRISTRGTE